MFLPHNRQTTLRRNEPSVGELNLLAQVRAYTHVVLERIRWKGFIHKGSHAGWYSVSDETFYPSTQVERHEKDGVKIHIFWLTGLNGKKRKLTSSTFPPSGNLSPRITHRNHKQYNRNNSHADIVSSLQEPLEDLSI